MNDDQREAQILQAFAYATPDEVTALNQELTQIRTIRAQRISAERQIDLDNTLAAVRTPVPVHGSATSNSDWLDEIDVESDDSDESSKEMAVEATLWVEALDEDIVEDDDEFMAQLEGASSRSASKWINLEGAKASFVAEARRLRSKRLGSKTAGNASGMVRVVEGTGYSSGNPTFTVQFMGSEDSMGYGVWEDVTTVSSMEEAEARIAQYQNVTRRPDVKRSEASHKTAAPGPEWSRSDAGYVIDGQEYVVGMARADAVCVVMETSIPEGMECYVQPYGQSDTEVLSRGGASILESDYMGYGNRVGARKTAALFGSQSEHLAHPPSTWVVSNNGYRWELKADPNKDGVLDTFSTKRDALAAKEPGSWLVKEYNEWTQWYLDNPDRDVSLASRKRSALGINGYGLDKREIRPGRILWLEGVYEVEVSHEDPSAPGHWYLTDGMRVSEDSLAPGEIPTGELFDGIDQFINDGGLTSSLKTAALQVGDAVQLIGGFEDGITGTIAEVLDDGRYMVNVPYGKVDNPEFQSYADEGRDLGPFSHARVEKVGSLKTAKINGYGLDTSTIAPGQTLWQEGVADVYVDSADPGSPGHWMIDDGSGRGLIRVHEDSLAPAEIPTDELFEGIDQFINDGGFTASRKTAGAYDSFVGRGYVGFPGSEILAVVPNWESMGTGIMEVGAVAGTITLLLEDGREVKIPSVNLDRNLRDTYERKTAAVDEERLIFETKINRPGTPAGAPVRQMPERVEASPRLTVSKTASDVDLEQSGEAGSTLSDVTVESAPEAQEDQFWDEEPPLASPTAASSTPTVWAVAGPNGAYATDQYNSGIRVDVPAGTKATGYVAGMTMFGKSYTWEIEGEVGQNWSVLSNNGWEQVAGPHEASRTASSVDSAPVGVEDPGDEPDPDPLDPLNQGMAPGAVASSKLAADAPKFSVGDRVVDESGAEGEIVTEGKGGYDLELGGKTIQYRVRFDGKDGQGNWRDEWELSPVSASRKTASVTNRFGLRLDNLTPGDTYFVDGREPMVYETRDSDTELWMRPTGGGARKIEADRVSSVPVTDGRFFEREASRKTAAGRFEWKWPGTRTPDSMVVMPVTNLDSNERIAQGDRSIVRFDINSGKGVANWKGSGSKYFHDLTVGWGNAEEVTMPREFIDLALGNEYRSGDAIGQGVFVANRKTAGYVVVNTETGKVISQPYETADEAHSEMMSGAYDADNTGNFGSIDLGVDIIDEAGNLFGFDQGRRASRRKQADVGLPAPGGEPDPDPLDPLNQGEAPGAVSDAAKLAAFRNRVKKNAQARGNPADTGGMTKKTASGSLPNVGDYWYSDWGYDQTNIDFYRVERVSDSSVWLVKVPKKVVSGGAMQSVVPDTSGQTVGEVFRRKMTFSRYDGQPSVSIGDYAGASPWDGRPKSENAPGYGR